MKLMDFDQLDYSINELTKEFRQLQRQVIYLRQRESDLLASNRTLQQQLNTTQTKVQQVVSRLKLIEE